MNLADSPQALGTEVASAPSARRGGRPALNWLFEKQGYQYVTLGVDAALLVVALVVADAINPDSSYLPVLVLSPLAILLLASSRMYDPRAQISRLDRVAAIVGSTAVAALLVGGMVELTRPSATDSGLIAIQFALATALLVGWRMAWSTMRRRVRRELRCGRRTLIVGAGEVGGRLEARLRRLGEIGLIPVGFVDASPVSTDELDRREAPVLGSPAEFSAIVEETGADHAILAFQLEPDVTLRRIVRQCQEREVTMSVVPRLFDDVTNRIALEHVGGMALFEFRQVDPQGWQFALKHGFDRTVAALLLIFLSPVLAGVALAVRLSSPGPALFRQRRVGRDGQIFDVLKFRSMRPAPEGDDLPRLEGDSAPGGVEGDDRRTTVGRFIRAWSLDELPQLVNVLRGEMSLIGPRPERPELAGDFAGRIHRYEERHRVRSGITGWAQVNGLGPGTSLEERAEWDNWYIQNWTFWLDFKILLMTIPAVLRPSE